MPPRAPERRPTDGRRYSVYQALDVSGRLLYVGVSVDPARRARQHAGRHAWWPEVVTVLVAWFETNWRAALIEHAIAVREKPAYGFANPYVGIRGLTLPSDDEVWAAEWCPLA